MKSSRYKYSPQSGFTIIELVVVMVLFIIVIMIAAQTFSGIVTQSSKLFKSEESNIEGVIGLEVMKHDLEQMGFGLPWGWSKANSSATPTDIIDSTISYQEAVDSLGLSLNDQPAGVPRAFVAFAGFGNFSSAYFAVKATTVGSSRASQRWTYIPFHNVNTATGLESRPISFASYNPTVGDKVILINSNFNDPDNKDHRLIVDATNNSIFHINFNTSGSIADSNLPTDDQQTYMVYGVDSDSGLRMPFNRADFFIKVPGGVASKDGSTDGGLPPFCAEKTGVLYKATVNHADGKYKYIPLLDCVADMQVVLGWDSSDGGYAASVNTYSSPPQSDGTVANITTTDPALAAIVREAMTSQTSVPKGWLYDAKGLREHLKIIKVYILAQNGKRDTGYTTPSSSIVVGDKLENNGLPVKTYTLTEAQTHYRWKLYRIVVRPKNLLSNQR